MLTSDSGISNPHEKSYNDNERNSKKKQTFKGKTYRIIQQKQDFSFLEVLGYGILTFLSLGLVLKFLKSIDFKQKQKSIPVTFCVNPTYGLSSNEVKNFFSKATSNELFYIEDIPKRVSNEIPPERVNDFNYKKLNSKAIENLFTMNKSGDLNISLINSLSEENLLLVLPCIQLDKIKVNEHNVRHLSQLLAYLPLSSFEHMTLEGIEDGDLKLKLLEIQQKIDNAKKRAIQKKEAAIIKIQGMLRTYLALSKHDEIAKKHLIKNSLFQRAKIYIDSPEKLANLPQANAGNSPVYFLDKLRVVLKKSLKINQRFLKILSARNICLELGYSHLAVPKARIHGEFLIEKCLPIARVFDTKEQIGFYLEHLEQFTDAVKDFTAFLFQTSLGDLSGNTSDPFATFSNVPIGRYDNIGMYLKDGMGRLGLIDLELKAHSDAPLDKCLEAIRLFPYHFDIILETAKKFDPNIGQHLERLENERDEVMQYFKSLYLDHLDYVKENHISLKSPTTFKPISETRKEQIKQRLGEVLKNLNYAGKYKGCLGENEEETIKKFNTSAVPNLLDNIVKFFELTMRNNLELNAQNSREFTYASLLTVRTLKFDLSLEQLDELIGSSLTMLTFNQERKKAPFSEELLKEICLELENGREIAYYNPHFGRGPGGSMHLIFC